MDIRGKNVYFELKGNTKLGEAILAVLDVAGCSIDKGDYRDVIGLYEDMDVQYVDESYGPVATFADLESLFKPIETIEIAGKKYSKEEFEEAVKELKEIR